MIRVMVFLSVSFVIGIELFLGKYELLGGREEL